MTWLIEQKRSSTVEKFTGTLSHKPTGSGITHDTVHAFAHFVYELTGHQLVAADLQGRNFLYATTAEDS